MKKFGYTIAEALIAMTIVGIIAAIMVPMVNKFKPNTNKIMFLKTYDTIVDILDSVMYNKQIYPSTGVDGATNYDYSLAPLYNTSSANLDDTEIRNIDNKICDVIAWAMEVKNPACNIAFQANSYEARFVNKHGVGFDVRTAKTGVTSYYTSITIDVNPDGENCFYDANTCPNPDRFALWLFANGEILPGDRMASAYLNTRSNYRYNDADIDSSDEVISLLEVLVKGRENPKPKSID